jgi:hypothetical protein
MLDGPEPITSSSQLNSSSHRTHHLHPETEFREVHNGEKRQTAKFPEQEGVPAADSVNTMLLPDSRINFHF